MTNWTNSHGRVSEAYKVGVNSAEGTIDKAIAAKSLYEAKMAQSIAEGRREKGLARVSNEQWKAAAANKGSARIVQGMKDATPAMRAGMSRVLNKLGSIELPARSADGMENLVNRGGAVVKGLMELKRE